MDQPVQLTKSIKSVSRFPRIFFIIMIFLAATLRHNKGHISIWLQSSINSKQYKERLPLLVTLQFFNC